MHKYIVIGVVKTNINEFEFEVSKDDLRAHFIQEMQSNECNVEVESVEVIEIEVF